MVRPQLIITKIALSGLLSLFLLIGLAAIYWTGPYVWDDGAITLAYARTLAEKGVFSLTGASEIVEGTSSLLFTFIAAAAHKIMHFNFVQFIFFAQFAAFIFLCATVFITHQLLSKIIRTPDYSLIIALLMGCMPMFTAEIMNGMEMTLFSALMLLLISCYEQPSKNYMWVIPLLLLARFEAIYYLLFTGVFLAIFDKKNRPHLYHYLVYTIFVFAVISALRYAYFGDLLPNTIYAKMHSPYSSDAKDVYAQMRDKTDGLLQFGRVYLAFIIALLAVIVLHKDRYSLLSNIKFWMVLAFASFAFIAACNWGYRGRIPLACLPVFTLLLAEMIRKDNIRMICVVGCLGATFYCNSNLITENNHTMMFGNANQMQFLADNVGDIHRDYGITPANYRITGLAVDELRKLLDLQTIRFMGPDVGGLGLCCDNIKVIDSALLTNRFIAKNGYAKFEQLIATTKPDVIETHGIWSYLTHIYDSPFFQANYLPIVFKQNLFWINRICFRQLANKVTFLPVPNIRTLENTRYGLEPYGRDYIIKRFSGTVYMVEPKAG